MTTYIANDSYEFNQIPKNVSVSTTGVTFELGVNVNLKYVFKLVKLNDILVGMKYKNEVKQSEEIVMKISEKTFNNQLTMKLKIAEDKYVSVKIFLNGSIQIAGSKSIEQINKGIGCLIKILKYSGPSIYDVSKIEGLLIISYILSVIYVTVFNDNCD